MGITLKQYADLHGISYEAVRGSFCTHKDRDLLEGTHYTTTGRQRILTEAGIAVMDSFRPQSRKKPLAMHPDDIAALQVQIADLKAQIEDLESKRTALEDMIHVLNTENADLRLQIVELEKKLTDRSEAMIELQARFLEAQGRLLTAAEDTTKKQGFFSRLFGKK